MRFRARAAYDGSGFRGWQAQAYTLSGCWKMYYPLNRMVTIVGAGRTDASLEVRHSILMSILMK